MAHLPSPARSCACGEGSGVGAISSSNKEPPTPALPPLASLAGEGETAAGSRLRSAILRARRLQHTGRIVIFIELDRLAAAKAPEIDLGGLDATAGVFVGPGAAATREHRITLGDIFVDRVVDHAPIRQQVFEVFAQRFAIVIGRKERDRRRAARE